MQFKIGVMLCLLGIVMSTGYLAMLNVVEQTSREIQSVPFGIIPLAPEGKAKSFAHLCPDLSSDKPEHLGAYYRFRPKQPQKKPTETQHMALIGDDYYLHKPKWRIVAQLGHLPDTMLRAYSGGDEV